MGDKVEPAFHGYEWEARSRNCHDRYHDNFLRRIDLYLISLSFKEFDLWWRQSEATSIIAGEVLSIDELNWDEDYKCTGYIVGRVWNLMRCIKVAIVKTKNELQLIIVQAAEFAKSFLDLMHLGCILGLVGLLIFFARICQIGRQREFALLDFLCCTFIILFRGWVDQVLFGLELCCEIMCAAISTIRHICRWPFASHISFWVEELILQVFVFLLPIIAITITIGALQTVTSVIVIDFLFQNLIFRVLIFGRVSSFATIEAHCC